MSGLLDEMIQKINQLNESQSQEKERVTKLEGLFNYLSTGKGLMIPNRRIEQTISLKNLGSQIK